MAPLAASSSGSRKWESKLKLEAFWWGDEVARAGEGGAGQEAVGACRGEEREGGPVEGPGGRGTLKTGSGPEKRDTFDFGFGRFA